MLEFLCNLSWSTPAQERAPPLQPQEEAPGTACILRLTGLHPPSEACSVWVETSALAGADAPTPAKKHATWCITTKSENLCMLLWPETPFFAPCCVKWCICWRHLGSCALGLSFIQAFPYLAPAKRLLDSSLIRDQVLYRASRPLTKFLEAQEHLKQSPETAVQMPASVSCFLISLRYLPCYPSMSLTSSVTHPVPTYD